MSEASILFDAPGPRARRLYVIVAVLGAAVIVGLLTLMVIGLANPGNNQFTAEKWLPFLQSDTWTAYLLPGLVGTLVASVISVALSICFGLLLGMGRLSQHRWVRWATGGFVEFFRAVPVLMMMLFAYYAGLFTLHLGGNLLPLFGVVVGLTVYNSCVLAELVRSGVGSLPRGQRESGLAIGLTPFQTLRIILLPQAITAMLPSMLSQLVVIVKDSALGSMIAYSELLRAGTNLSTRYGNLIPSLFVLAAMYIVLNYLLTRLAGVVEARLHRGPRHVEGQGPTAGMVPEPAAEPDIPQTVMPTPDHRRGREKPR